MARVLLAWELGGDYGHLMRFLTLARELARRGHEPVFALKDLVHVDTVLRGEPYAVFPAPVWQAQVGGLPPPIGFAETLLRLGFLHPVALAGMCRAWRSLVAAIRPSLILFDYAPTGLLATRGLGIPRALFGASFGSPPRSEPMPVYRWWRPEPRARVVESERLALAGANETLARLGERPMARLSELLDVEEDFVAAEAELDQYPDRGNARYRGDVANLDRGVPPRWPSVGARRVFAYVKPQYRDFDKLLEALRATDASVIVHAPGVSAKAVRTHTAGNLAFSAEPVRMADLRRECDFGVCHSGASTTAALLTAGKPLLLLPQHLEQMMTARRVEALGAGLAVDFERPAPNYRKLLERLLGEPGFAAAARAIGERHAGDDPAARVAGIADRCEELMQGAAAGGPEAAA